MSSSDNIRLYRKRAAEMELLAVETKFASMREAYLRLAEEWNLLADSLEHQARMLGVSAPHRDERSFSRR